MDIHLFVSVVIQIFVSAQEELSKTDLLFQSYDSRFAKINNSEIEELFAVFGQCLEGKWKILKTWYALLSNLKPRKTKIQNQLIWHYLDYGALRKEHLDSLTNFINRYEKLKGSLDYN